MPVPAGLSLDELKEHLDSELSANDALLERLLEAAFLQAQAPSPYGCGRVLAPDPALVPGAGEEDPPTDTADPVEREIPRRRRWLAGDATGIERLAVPDAREITAVEVDGSALTNTDWATSFTKDGLIAQVEFPTALPAASGTSSVCTITGRFGFLTIPQNLRTAIYVLAARAFHERDAAYADQVAIAEVGGVQSYYRQLPPATKLAFASYSLPSGLAGLA